MKNLKISILLISIIIITFIITRQFIMLHKEFKSIEIPTKKSRHLIKKNLRKLMENHTNLEGKKYE